MFNFSKKSKKDAKASSIRKDQSVPSHLSSLDFKSNTSIDKLDPEEIKKLSKPDFQDLRPKLVGSNIKGDDNVNNMDDMELIKEERKLKQDLAHTDQMIKINEQNIKDSQIKKDVDLIPQKMQGFSGISLDKTTDVNKIRDMNNKNSLNCRFLNSKKCHPQFPNFAGASINLGENATISCDGVDEQKQAELVCSISKGKITNIYVINKGLGYTKKPKISIVGGGGKNVVLDPIISNSKIKGVTVINGGEGFHETPILQVDPPSLSNACYLCCK